MALKTPLCNLLGIEVPILQAPVSEAAAPSLVMAVSNAGGLGMLGVSWFNTSQTRQVIRETRNGTDKPFAVNMVLEWDQEERFAVCLEEGVKIFSFFWGDPSPFVRRIHDIGGLVMQTIGSTEEAIKAIQAGVDVIVAQGWEAGGHVRGQVASLPLIPRVVDAVAPIPVVAAGGIGDGRGIAAALALGAAGVWIGTRFLCSVEADVHPIYKNNIIRASETDTAYGCLFDIGWQNAPHRVLRNSTVAMWEEAGCPGSGSRPGEGEVIAHGADDVDVLRYSDYIPSPRTVGNVEALALYAGQSAGLVKQIKPAQEIIWDLLSETNEALTLLNKRFS